ncbi:MAG: LuxR C-terminal-related transcriptional regulator [bacterium]|nr:LuxR C-terminal-related transcriptional regulator [bacterium]
MDVNKMPVLSVKLKVPKPRKRYIERNGLLKKLEDISNCKVTVIKAGAGSGKTTLLSLYALKHKELNVRWLAIDESMNQSLVFWKYVIESLKEELTLDVPSVLSCFDGNMPEDFLWELLSNVINNLNLEEELVLVWDDFWYLTDPFLIKTIDYFIENLPEQVHLVLLTRNKPLVYLGLLQVEGNLLLLEEDQIRMSTEEGKEFLVHTIGLQEDDKAIEDLVSNSNGWVGGLQLMAIASSKLALSRDVNEQVIYDYLSNEVFRYLPEDVRQFLRKTGVLAYFNKEICNKYVPEFSFEKMMQAVLERNMFVIELDEEQQEYRYHSILKDYLVHLVGEDEQEEIILRTKAAAVYHEIGDDEESINQLFVIHAYKQIMEQLLNMPQNAATFNYIMKVPMEQIQYNANFAYQYFFCYYTTLEQKKCNEIYEFIKKHFKNDPTYQAFRHVDLFFDVDWNYKWVSIVPLDQIKKMPFNDISKAYLLIKEAYFLYMQDQRVEAMEYLDLAEQIYEKKGNYYIEAFVLAEKTQILEEYGSFREALTLYRKMERFLEYVPTLRSSYYIGIAGVYIRQLKMAEAKEALDNSKQYFKQTMTNMQSAYLYTFAEYSYIMGKEDVTESIIIELGKDDMYQNIYFSARLLRYPIYRGNHRKLAAEFVDKYDKADDIVKSNETDLLYAGIKYELGEFDVALEKMETLIAKARKSQNVSKIVEGDLLKVRYLLEQTDRVRELLDTFVEAVSYAYGEEMRHPFWFEKETVKQVLAKFKEELKGRLSQDQIYFVESTEEPQAEKSISRKGLYDLTERELEVVEELKKGCTNKEIAEHLCISLATVKTHMINIYSKLGVKNRVAAVNKIMHKER